MGLFLPAFPRAFRLFQHTSPFFGLSFACVLDGSLGGGEMPHPMRFSGAFAFQWVNPKLWVMAVAIVALYVRPGHTLADTALVTSMLAAISWPVMLLWAGFGAGLRDMLQIPARIRAFNIVMGLALAASVLALLRM